MINRSVISDEVSQQPEEIIAFANAFSLDGLELRTVLDINPFEFDDALVNNLRARFADAGLHVPCLSLPLFKCDIDDLKTQRAQIEAFPRILRYANALGAKVLRGFCFWQCPAPEKRVREVYRTIAPMAADAGVRIALESDPSVNGHTASALLSLIECVDEPALGALFDGGNYLFAPDALSALDSYQILRRHIFHVHIKDAVREGDSARAVCIGTGKAQAHETLCALRQDNYNGWLSLETHYRLDSTLDESALRLPGGAAFSSGGAAASAESMRALNTLIEKIWRDE